MNNLQNIEGAERILVPAGRDTSACISAFQELYGIEVPTFAERTYVATSQGRTFWQVKGKDVPELIAKGCGDVGVTGNDSVVEYSGRTLVWRTIGVPMGRFSLLAAERNADAVADQIEYRPGGGVRLHPVITSLPGFLAAVASGRELNIMPADFKVNGKIEGMLALTGVDLAADIISTGKTACVNGLMEAYKLADIVPVVVGRAV